ncbi:DUF4838 domain-containing protein, partial [bacterium]|nr:DUF4838 domain-containing protein [bacterium]
WKLRNKMQLTETDIVGIPGDSWLRQYLPEPELAKTRPELFGQRPDGTADPYLANLTNPETIEIVAQKVIDKVRAAEQKGQPIHAVGFAPDDGVPMDHTPETMKLNQEFTDWTGREGVPNGVSITEEWFQFMNRVAERVTQEYPDLIITSNGYANRSIPPAGIALHPNMGVMYAYIWADTLKPMNHPKSWHGKVVAGEMERWCKLCKRVFLYEYHLTMLVTMLTPVPQIQKMAVNYPLMASWGLIGFFNEARQPYFEEGIATRYLRTKLFWDAQLDVPPALDDYYQHWYGPAAKPAAAFWKAIEDSLLDTPLLGHEDRILPYVYTPELLATLEQSVTNAERLAGAEPYATRIKVDRLTLEHLQAYLALHDAEFDARWADAAAQCDRMIELRMQLNAISPFLAMPPAKKAPERYYSGDGYYGVLDRREHFLKLADLTSSKTGDLVALAPATARFAMDPAGVGQALGWHQPGFDRRDWQEIDTTKPYYAQGYLSEDGVPTIGRMWYVFELDVPRKFARRSISVYSPVVTCQAWVWINGQYVGRRKYLDAYYRPAPIDLDVTRQIKPGQKNTIAVLVNTGVNRSQAADGFQGRLFLYAPKPAAN